MNRIKIYLIFLILILSIICINTKIEMLDNINSKTITKKAVLLSGEIFTRLII